MSQPLNVLIVEKSGTLKSLAIKDFKLEELFKKCGFKKGEDFLLQTEWNIKLDSKKYFIQVFGKTDGRPGSENKYDFPPPIDSTLLFGSCAIVLRIKKDDGQIIYADLTLSLWNKIYEKLFGGFKNLSTTAEEDENEDDELAKVSKSKKTKQGYLKDGFVVDSSDGDASESSSSTEDEDEENDDEEEEEESVEDSENIVVEDVGSELSEEEYDYN